MKLVRPGGACALVLAVALAGGCKRGEEPPAKRSPAPVDAPASTPADAAAPLSYASRNEDAEVKLTLPRGLAAHPDLHARLYAEGVKDLKAFVDGAKGDRAEMASIAGPGAEPPPTYSRSIAWTVEAETSKLLSMARFTEEYAGGAHGNHSYGWVLWDKALKRQLGPLALFRPGSEARLDKLLCDALIAAKKERLGEGYEAPGESSWRCPRWRDTAFTLWPSDAPAKTGGLQVLVQAYAIGPYAEGPYDAIIPRSAFADLLAPGYADEFAGEPAPRPADPPPEQLPAPAG